LDRFDLANTLDMARHLQPDARRVDIVAGADAFDTMWENFARRDLHPSAGGLEFDYLSGLPPSRGRGRPPDRHLHYRVRRAEGPQAGQPFTPDANTRTILDRAAKTAYKMSRVIGFQDGESGRSFRVYPDRRWLNPFADGRVRTRQGRWTWLGRMSPVGIGTSTLGSGCSPTITRSAPGWYPKRRAWVPNT
jgi:hypothetical protein